MSSNVDDRTYRAVHDFLLDEAALLDDRKFEDWLDLLADDLEYVMPVRATRGKDDGSEFVDDTRWYGDSRKSLEQRIRRIRARFPVSEDPPPRTRHFVSNIRVREGSRKDELEVACNVLVYRTRGESTGHDLFSAERRDVLRRDSGAFKLARREVLLDQAVVEAANLAVLF